MEAHEDMTRRVEEDNMELLPGLRQLRFGDNVVGVLAHGPYHGPSGANTTQQFPAHTSSSSTTPMPEYAEFTDSEDSDTSDGI